MGKAFGECAISSPNQDLHTTEQLTHFKCRRSFASLRMKGLRFRVSVVILSEAFAEGIAKHRIFSHVYLNHTKSQNAMNAAKAAPKISATSRAALTAAHR